MRSLACSTKCFKLTRSSSKGWFSPVAILTDMVWRVENANLLVILEGLVEKHDVKLRRRVDGKQHGKRCRALVAMEVVVRALSLPGIVVSRSSLNKLMRKGEEGGSGNAE